MQLKPEDWFQQLNVSWKEKFVREASMRKAAVNPEAILAADWLTIYETDQIDSLEPISAFSKLKRLSIHNKNGIDLSPLRIFGNRLEELTITESNADISVLKDFKKLEELTLHGSFANTPTPLLEKLEFLNMELSGRLESLNLKDIPIENLSILKPFTKIRRLRISNTEVTDISHLQSLKNLEELNLSDSPVSSFEILSKLPLRTFYADNTNLSDLKPFYKTKKMLTLYCRKTKVTFEELLRFRNSLSNSSLLALILVSDFNENNEAFVKSLEKIDFPLNELGGALTEWTYQRIGDLMTDNSGFNEDPKKEKIQEAIPILRTFLRLPEFKRDPATEKRYTALLQDSLFCTLCIGMDIDPDFDRKALDKTTDLIPDKIQSPRFAFLLARYFAKKKDRKQLLRYVSICISLKHKKDFFLKFEELKPFLEDDDFKILFSKMQE
ncbi:leucine-rich repeat domain-containing protein [Leptospira weilii]|uniref:Leucine rich repeat protein n=2 Tax=Leptospira weilii TaxID=28184 RepID=M6Q7H4_9LEPT|nr:leucine-rich repeat domain-containing protein [Leptospira weilii]EMN89120.1 leucine rich repeat protein [Leptospira weilii str. UI 13098]